MRAWVGLVGLILMVSGCGSADLTGVGGSGRHRDGATATVEPDFVEGTRLAHVDLSATHAIEFWEVKPGDVLMIQHWDTAHGETKLDLEEQLVEANGRYSELYRNLLNDPNAALSPELVAADEHRRHLPIRNALLPLPKAPQPQLSPANTGATAVNETGIVESPGALHLQTLPYHGGGIAAFVAPSWCTDPATDGGWCPDGAYYDHVNGNINETMYWDAIGHNPQASGGPMDAMSVYQWTEDSKHNWSSHRVFYYGLAPGHSVEAYSSTTAYYQGSIAGDLVSYAERWRLSFPSLIQVATHPGGGGGLSSDFGNDIQGITHDPYNTILSRTEYNITSPLWGVIGVVAYNEDLDQYSPTRFEYEEPGTWIAQGYNHFGDIAYAQTDVAGTLMLSDVYISLSNTAGQGGIGVWAGPGTSDGGDRGTILVSDSELAWLAINPKDGKIYASSGGSPIQGYKIHFPPCGTCYAPPVLDSTRNVSLVNGPVDGGIQGGKISRHGKLWVTSLSSDGNAVVTGIDPYTGVIQTSAEFPLNDIDVPFFKSFEMEGLDITDPNYTKDLLISSYRPGISGQIHVQVLANSYVYDDAWQLLNFDVSDLDRL